MAASPESEGPPPGAPPTLSGSKTVFLESIGTYCRTRRPRPNLSAAFPCSATHSPSDNQENAIVLKAFDTLLPDQGGSSYDFTRCFECNVCDLRGKREHRLDHRQFPALEGRKGARRRARRGATTAFCGQRCG